MNSKTLATIIARQKAKHPHLTDEEAYIEYVKERYHNPKAKADLLRAQQKAGKQSKNRPFKDPKKAAEAGRTRYAKD